MRSADPQGRIIFLPGICLAESKEQETYDDAVKPIQELTMRVATKEGW